MSRPRPEHEADLARLISGELDPSSPEGARILEQSGTSREELDALLALAGELESASTFRAEVERDARELAHAPGVDTVRRVLDEQAHGGPRRSRWAAWWIPLAAAALMLPLLYDLLVGNGAGTERREEQYLGGEVEVLEPVGEVDDFGAVRWRAVPDDAPRFRLEVRDASDPAQSELLLLHADLRESEVQLPPEAERWQHIKIWITQYGRDGTQLGSGWSESWRR